MDKKWTRCEIRNVVVLMLCAGVIGSVGTGENKNISVINEENKNYIDKLFSVDEFNIIPGIKVEKLESNITTYNVSDGCDEQRSTNSISDYVKSKLYTYLQDHRLSVDFKETGRFLLPPVDGGKSSFLAGFGMGFLAFALKKLMLPVFLGAQLVKSMLIAMLLPSILGGLGKIVGKGLSSFSGISGASTGLNHQHSQQIEDFNFKDVDPYSSEPGLGNDFNAEPAATNNLVSVSVNGDPNDTPSNSRFGFVNQRISYMQPQSDNYYMRRPNKKTDYKVFHKIPSSSLLLTSYDPFYSPLLSRLDAVFQQLGLGNDKSVETELCRERLVCLMYANPTKYAPYSNLVSAQLSRELNELRKPSSDNPEILRFFRYMKAAKDGQDGEECHTHGGCPSLNTHQPSPAILTTFNDINKLVLARKLE